MALNPWGQISPCRYPHRYRSAAIKATSEIGLSAVLWPGKSYFPNMVTPFKPSRILKTWVDKGASVAIH
jgi:hypothetical protein